MNDSMHKEQDEQAGQSSAGSQTRSVRAQGANPGANSGVNHDEIAKRAYAIYTQKGRKDGQCEQNWRQAEQELRAQGGTSGASGSSAPRSGSAGSSYQSASR